jgi:hypothetical protein
MSAEPGWSGDDQQTGRAGLNSAIKMKKPSGNSYARTAFFFQCWPIAGSLKRISGTKSQLANRLSIASS